MSDSRKDEKRRIKGVSREIGKDISEEAKKEYKSGKSFTRVERGKNEFDLDYVRLQMAKTKIITDSRTFMGEISAQSGKRKYIRSAEKASKTGMKEEAEQDMEDARTYAGITMGEVKSKNYETRNKAHQGIAVRNRVEHNSRNQSRSIEQIRQDIDDKDKVWAREKGRGSLRNSEVVRDIRKSKQE